jgi:hypothetical protein
VQVFVLRPSLTRTARERSSNCHVAQHRRRIDVRPYVWLSYGRRL